MAKTLKVRVEVAPVVVEVSRADYRDQYLEKCEEDGDEPDAEVPDEFILAAYKEDLDEGNTGLDEVFENAEVTVTAAP